MAYYTLALQCLGLSMLITQFFLSDSYCYSFTFYHACIQLHVHVGGQSTSPHLDNSHTALAMNNETFDSVVGADLVNIILACPIVAVVLAFAITVMLLVVYTKRDQWKKRSPLTISSKATLLSLTVINGSYASAFLSWILLQYQIEMDSSTLYMVKVILENRIIFSTTSLWSFLSLTCLLLFLLAWE